MTPPFEWTEIKDLKAAKLVVAKLDNAERKFILDALLVPKKFQPKYFKFGLSDSGDIFNNPGGKEKFLKEITEEAFDEIREESPSVKEKFGDTNFSSFLESDLGSVDKDSDNFTKIFEINSVEELKSLVSMNIAGFWSLKYNLNKDLRYYSPELKKYHAPITKK